MKTKVAMLSLGCARNLVDAEVILGNLKAAGFKVVEEVTQADVACVNTCCFIGPAQEESVQAILELCRLKKEGRLDKILVCGCLVQRHQQQLLGELKQVDAFVDVGSIRQIVPVLKKLLRGATAVAEFGKPEFLYSHLSAREFLSPRHFAYIKISEGCSHRCSYCIIPGLRGEYRSRRMSSILKEAQFLFNSRKVKEINLIAQDTTRYGQDLYGQSRLDKLLQKISAQGNGKWIRLLYAHPENFPEQIIPVIRESSNICKYIDLPIQHINDKILRRMRRGTTRKQMFSLIELLRKEIPGVGIRTTLIVGFPGETDRQFSELLEFIRQAKFERLGLFQYSQEENTPAFNLREQIPQKVKQERYQQACSLQQDVSRQINQEFLGKELTVLIDEKDAQDASQFVGRTQYDAPEVDGCVYVHARKRLNIGDFVQVKVIDTLEYDLVAEAI